MDLLSKEQKIYDEAVKVLLSSEEDTKLNMQPYSKLVEEYGKLLKQFRQYRQMTSLSERNTSHFGAEKNEILGKAHFDVLTGIFNKHYLSESLDQTLANMAKAGDILSVLLIDIDHFNQYNEIYSRNAGDDCLRSIASVLKDCLFRGQDFVARYGGEEFIAILPHTSEQGARLVADRMIEEVRRLHIPHSGNDSVGYVTVSIGIVTGVKKAGNWSAADFFRCADEALFQAKNHGRNQYAYLHLK
ncbi:MAG: GGDEF domain-containing protein [Defluviitaleaceae bacterium]|nr:GGDEF domain-containing protein [Defluviitaleaceae bacterium]